MKYQLSVKDSTDTWYILPTMGGHLLSYYKLSKLLYDSCIGLTCKGLDRNVPICNTLDEHIDYFLNLLDPNQDTYNFIGYCLGGLFITELDKYININKSIIINFPYKLSDLNYDSTNIPKKYNNVLYQNKLIWNNWYEEIFSMSTIQIKHTCCLIESYKGSNIVEKIIPTHYIPIDIENHLNILKEPTITQIANYINTFRKSEIIKHE